MKKIPFIFVFFFLFSVGLPVFATHERSCPEGVIPSSQSCAQGVPGGGVLQHQVTGGSGAITGSGSANVTDYHLLAPFPGNPGYDPNQSNRVQGPATQGLATYLQAVFAVLLGLAVILAVIMIVIGGIQWMGSESIFSHEEARKRIVEAIWGLLLAFLAYIILLAINPRLLEVGFNLPGLELTGAKFAPYNVEIGWVGWGDGDSPTGGPVTGPSAGNEQEIRDELNKNNPPITVNSGPCPTAAGACTGGSCQQAGCTSGCTNVGGLPQLAITGLKGIASAVGSIQITGGTEAGHCSHGVGQAVVDLSPSSNQALSPWIIDNAVVTGTAFGYPCYYTTGHSFVREPTHWHVVFQKNICN